MYTPSYFSEVDSERIFALIERYGFATVISNSTGDQQITHAPLQVDRNRGVLGTLIGHMARANPHASLLRDEPQVVAIFHGPHAYVSPTWYVDENPHDRNVPTWNYAAVHVYGRVRRIDDDARKWRIVADLAAQHEQGSAQAWDPGDLARHASKLGAIVGFEVEIDRIEAKTKFSQNRSVADQEAVIVKLEGNESADKRAMAALMRENIARDR